MYIENERSCVEIVHDAISPFTKEPNKDNWDHLSETIKMMKQDPETCRWVDRVKHDNNIARQNLDKLKENNGVYYAR